jgi:hypothetical protein
MQMEADAKEIQNPAHDSARARAVYAIQAFVTAILPGCGSSTHRLASCNKRGADSASAGVRDMEAASTQFFVVRAS